MRTSAKAKLLAARLAALTVSLGVAGVVTMSASRAAFNDTTDNGSNTWSAGTVDLTDDDSSTVMFNVSNMKPGSTTTKCIRVTYNGSLAADVKAYATVAGTGLATHLNATVEVGAGGTFADCTGFVAGGTSFTGTLAALGTTHANFSNGLGGFTGAAATHHRTYRVTVELPSSATNAAQGLNASATLTWEAQNT